MLIFKRVIVVQPTANFTTVSSKNLFRSIKYCRLLHEELPNHDKKTTRYFIIELN